MNPALLLARFRTKREAAKVQRIVAKMYAEHRALVTAASYAGPEVVDALVQPSAPMRAVGRAHGFAWPAGDGISVEPDSEGRFTVACVGSVLVVHHPYALHYGEAGITLLAKRHGSDLVITSERDDLRLRVSAEGDPGRAELAALAEEPPYAAKRLTSRPRGSFVLELPDQRSIQFDQTIEGHEAFAECILAIGRIARVKVWFEGAPTQLARIQLRNLATTMLETLTLERDANGFALRASPTSATTHATLHDAAVEMRRQVLARSARGTVVVFDGDVLDRVRASMVREAHRAGLPAEVLREILGRDPEVGAREVASAALIARAAAEPHLGRRIALTAPISEDELQDVVQRHAAWLERHRDGPHIWVHMRITPALRVVIDALDDPQRTSLSRRDLRGRRLRGVDLTGVQMIDAIADDVELAAANLSNVFATDLRARGARFDGATLRDADFSRSDFTNASFRDADCTGVDFENCIFDGADFSGAILTGALHAPA